MEPSELEENENKLRKLIGQLYKDKHSESQKSLSKATQRKLGYANLEVLLMSTKDKEILEAFGSDEDEHLREHVAGNANTPEKLLDELSRDGIFYNQLAVAMNTSTSTVTLLWMNRYLDSLDISKAVINQLGNRQVQVKQGSVTEKF